MRDALIGAVLATAVFLVFTRVLGLALPALLPKLDPAETGPVDTSRRPRCRASPSR